MPYNFIVSYLINNGLVEPNELNPIPLPHPPGFDPNARCNFHAGAPGYSVEDCKALKNKVHDLIDSKMISFVPQCLHINNNCSPCHTGPSVHDMEESVENRCEDDYYTGLNEQLWRRLAQQQIKKGKLSSSMSTILAHIITLLV